MCEIIYWVLYGRTVRGAKHEKVLRRGQLECSGEVVFRRDGHLYEVTRSWSRSDHTLSLVIDGNEDRDPEEMHLKKDIQRSIDEALGLTPDQFVQVVYLDLKRRFGSLKDAEKKDVLDSFFGSPVYGLAAEAVNKEKKRERLVETHTERDRQLSKARTEFEFQRTQVQTQAADAEPRRIQEQTVLMGLEADRKTTLGQAVAVKRELAAAKALLEALPVPPAAGADSALSVKLSKMTELLQRTERECWQLQQKVQQYQAIESGTCPTCKRSTALTYDQVEELRAAREQLTRMEAKRLQTKEAVSQVQTRIRNERAAEVTIQQESVQVSRDVTRKEQEFERLRQGVLRMDEKIRASHAALQRLDELAVSLAQQLLALKLTYDQAQERSDEAHARLQLLVDVEYHLGPKGVQAFAIDRALGQLNLTLERVDRAFGGELHVQLEPERTTKKETTLQTVTLISDPPYDSASLSERTRIDLIIQLSLRALLEESRGAPSLLIVDECELGLDSLGIETFIGVLAELDKRVLFVTNNAVARNVINDCWTVTKHNGISQLVERD